MTGMQVDDPSTRIHLVTTPNCCWTLVTYPTIQIAPLHGPLISNPALWEEIGLFFVVLIVGVVLLTQAHDDKLRLFDYGSLFFDAGVVPVLSVIVAPIVRSIWKNQQESNELLYQPISIVMYMAFLTVGAAMMAFDQNMFSPSDDMEEVSWPGIIGGSLFGAGLIYFASRSFFLHEAPEDRVRRLEKEVGFLRESVSKGMSLAYFLNFLKWVCKDMVASRQLNNGTINFKPNDAASNVEDISSMVVIVPMLEVFNFEESWRDRTDIMVQFQKRLEGDFRDRAVRGFISNNPGDLSRSRGQNILKVKVKGPFVGGQDNVTVFVDIPTTLLALWWNAMSTDSQYKTPAQRYEAYRRDVRRFSSNLAGTLRKNDMADLVTVIEYEGSLDHFGNTLSMAILEHHHTNQALNVNPLNPPPQPQPTPTPAGTV